MIEAGRADEEIGDAGAGRAAVCRVRRLPEKCANRRCTEPPPVNDGTQVSYERYRTCKDGAQVIVYSPAGGGHTWPGGWQYLPAAVIGKITQNMDASAVIWQFLTQFPNGQA